jgi:hypothetical protein
MVCKSGASPECGLTGVESDIRSRFPEDCLNTVLLYAAT